jgi:hypothetical protein
MPHTPTHTSAHTHTHTLELEHRCYINGSDPNRPLKALNREPGEALLFKGGVFGGVMDGEGGKEDNDVLGLSIGDDEAFGAMLLLSITSLCCFWT